MAGRARRAEIKRAEGIKQAKILEAEGEALAIQLVNEAADRYFTGNAQLLRRRITVERSLQNNSRAVVPAASELVNILGDVILGDVAGVPRCRARNPMTSVNC